MKISPVTRILLAGAIIVGSMGLSGCKIKCGEAEPAQLSQEGRTNASTSLLTLMAAIGDERLSTLCGLDIGCTSRTYLSDSFADLYEDPKIYLDYEQGANQAVSFYGMETAAEGGSVIIFGALNNVDNRSLRMDAGDISALTEILVDIVYSDTKPDKLTKYSTESVDLANQLAGRMDYSAFTDAIYDGNFVKILHSIVQDEDDFDKLVQLLGYLGRGASYCTNQKFSNLAEGYYEIDWPACRSTSAEENKMKDRLNEEFNNFLASMRADYMDPEKPLCVKKISIEEYLTLHILTSFDGVDPSLQENVTYREFEYGGAIFLIDDFGVIHYHDENGKIVSTGLNVYNAALNVLAQSEYGTTHTNDFAPVTFWNSTYAFPSEEITRRDLLDNLASQDPSDVLSITMSTLLPELSGMDFKEIIDYLSNMGPYNFDFEAEVERLYKQLQEYRSRRLEPRFTGSFSKKPWDII